MQGIKAFVGHSFSETDKDVIRIFLDHFDVLKKAHGGGFTWDHAEEAEALPLSDKVLAKIEDKNVFIGICTAKERAVEPRKLKRVWWSGELKAADADLVWKTSDWLIQEIGLAVGRGMSIIIFLESGVRAPGGLHGNTEYIPFSRANPQEAFDKLLQMLVAISPKEVISTTEETKSSAPKDKIQERKIERDFEPRDDWGFDEYDDAAFWAVYDDNSEAFSKVDAAFKRSIHAQGNEGIIWEVRIEYWRLLFGRAADFGKMKRLAEEHKDVPEVLSYLAAGHAKFEEFEKAAEKYEQAAIKAADDPSRASYLGNAATQYSKSGNPKKAAQLVAEIKALAVKDANAQASVLSALTEIAEQEKDEDLLLILLEHRVEINPTDVQTRFSLAYKYSENENPDMALYHYLKIPGHQRDAVTWNNVGVSYGEFHLPVKGTKAFRKSADAGSTLAMTNLGNKLLSAGFYDEAKAECDKALAIPDCDKSVPVLLTRLKEVGEEEDKKLQEALTKVKPKAEFLRGVGGRVSMPLPLNIKRKWVAPEGTLEADLTNDRIKIFGTYEQPVSRLALALSGPLGETGASTTRHRIEFVGRMRGMAFFGSVSRASDTQSAATTMLFGGTKVIMYLNDAQTEFSVMEDYQSQSPTFYVLKSVV